MKRYWILIGMSYAVIGTTLSLQPGEKIHIRGEEREVIGQYVATHKFIPVD